jgi:CO/xanthine dehydrogenase FAD-binding subunit
VTLDAAAGDGVVVDASGLEVLRAISVAPNGAATIGAFTTRAALAAALPSLAPADATLANVRMRLALADARATVYGLGRTRTSGLDELALAPYELPVSIDVPPQKRGLGIGERRRATNDGAASYVIGVTVALRVSMLARFEHVRIFVDVDGEVHRAKPAEAKLERTGCNGDLFPQVARLAASAIPTHDARSSAIARALLPLVLAALRDAYLAARAQATTSP